MKVDQTTKLIFLWILIVASSSSIVVGKAKISDPVKLGCFPKANQVSVFQHSNFRGICSILPIDEYASSKHIRMADNSISSIRVGKNVQIEVCENYEKRLSGGISGGPQLCQIFTRSIRNLKNTRIGNDVISYAEVKLKGSTLNPNKTACAPKKDQVTIYQHANFKGNCRILGVGSYENSNRMNFKNDSVSSIEFAPDSRVVAKLCQHSNFKGRCELLSTSDAKLKNNQIGNDAVSSMRIIRK